MGQNIVVDPSNPLPFFGPETIFIQSYGDHPIVKPLADGNLPVLMNVARWLAVERSGAQSDRAPAHLGRGVEASGLANLQDVKRDAADLAGPILLGVAVESAAAGEGQRPTRLVVFGDSEFAANQLLEANIAIPCCSPTP